MIAIALFAGGRLSSRWASVGIPMAAMMLSDWALGWHSTVFVVYGTLILISLMGEAGLKNGRGGPGLISSMGAAASALFFVITNLGVWWIDGLYDKSVAGLLSCFVAALPFFPATLLSTWIYSAVLFGINDYLPVKSAGRQWSRS